MFVPFSYQQECLKALETVREIEDADRALMVMASGLGKTVTVAFDTKQWREKHTGRVLYLCNQNEILTQAKNTFEVIHGKERTYGFFNGTEKNVHRVDFLFSTLQTMKSHKKSFAPDEFAYIFVDESHHSQAETYRSTIEYFTPQFLLGGTATPNRLDELNIRDIYGEEIYSLPLEEALARRLLSAVEYRMITDEITIPPGLLESGRIPTIADLNAGIFSERHDGEVVRTIRRHMARLEQPRVIVFLSSVEECNIFSELMPDSFAIHSKIPPKEQSLRLEMFRQGLVNVVLTVDMFNEGIDIPQANMVVFLRATDSANIFYQQLGRGLRKHGGDKIMIALDFVANCERILMVHLLEERVQRASKEIEQKEREVSGLSQTEKTGVEKKKLPPPFVINGDTPGFAEKIIPLLKLLKLSRPVLFATWLEAGIAARILGITSKIEYAAKHFADTRLPSCPRYTYRKDFPGWEIFLGKRSAIRYMNWKDASRAAIALGITTLVEYKQRYIEDPHLPAYPPSYKNFPGWPVFLGREIDFYPTWDEALAVCMKHGVASAADYQMLCKKDSRLPQNPEYRYKDFPGFIKAALSNRTKTENPYPTWQEAGKAAQALGIKSSVEYHTKSKADSRLYGSPTKSYSDFPGWAVFLGIPELGNVQNPYPTWQEASQAAQLLKIKKNKDYKERRRQDPRLPGNPDRYPNFPGWRMFLGKTKNVSSD